jgi:hypothetical protein
MMNLMLSQWWSHELTNHQPTSEAALTSRLGPMLISSLLELFPSFNGSEYKSIKQDGEVRFEMTDRMNEKHMPFVDRLILIGSKVHNDELQCKSLDIC